MGTPENISKNSLEFTSPPGPPIKVAQHTAPLSRKPRGIDGFLALLPKNSVDTLNMASNIPPPMKYHTMRKPKSIVEAEMKLRKSSLDLINMKVDSKRRREISSSTLYSSHSSTTSNVSFDLRENTLENIGSRDETISSSSEYESAGEFSPLEKPHFIENKSHESIARLYLPLLHVLPAHKVTDACLQANLDHYPIRKRRALVEPMKAEVISLEDTLEDPFENSFTPPIPPILPPEIMDGSEPTESMSSEGECPTSSTLFMSNQVDQFSGGDSFDSENYGVEIINIEKHFLDICSEKSKLRASRAKKSGRKLYRSAFDALFETFNSR